MKNHKTIPMILAFGMLLMSILACSLAGTTAEKPTTQPEPPKQEVSSPTDNPGQVETTIGAPVLKSNFPLPDKAKVIQSSDEMVTATVNMAMKDVVEFYRTDAKTKGLTEYDLLTAITDNTFSLVFRVPGQEKELVIQGTAIASDNVAFSVRYEETDVK